MVGLIYVKASRRLGLMARTVKVRNLEVMRGCTNVWLYRPHLEYCASAWLPHFVKDGELLERVQRRFSRMVSGLRGLDYKDRLERFGLMTLGERRTAGGPDRVVQNIKRIVCHIVGIFFELDTSGRTRGRTQVKEKKISNRHYRN